MRLRLCVCLVKVICFFASCLATTCFESIADKQVARLRENYFESIMWQASAAGSWYGFRVRLCYAVARLETVNGGCLQSTVRATTPAPQPTERCSACAFAGANAGRGVVRHP